MWRYWDLSAGQMRELLAVARRGGQRVSENDAVVAALWKRKGMLAGAAGIADGEELQASVAFDMRRGRGMTAGAGVFGNAALAVAVGEGMTAGALRSARLSSIAGKVRAAVDGFPGERVSGDVALLSDDMARHPGGFLTGRIGMRVEVRNGVHTTSWRPFMRWEMMDLGGGPPCEMGLPSRVPFHIAVVASAAGGERGGVRVYEGVPRELLERYDARTDDEVFKALLASG